MGAAFGGQRISPIYTQADQYWVILELLPQYQQDAESLKRLYLATSRTASITTTNVGSSIPLTAVTNIRRGTQPLSINHTGQLPSVTLSFNLPVGVPERGRQRDGATKRDMASPPPCRAASWAPPSVPGLQRAWASLLIGGIPVVYIVLGGGLRLHPLH